jgi:hypothetical protein
MLAAGTSLQGALIAAALPCAMQEIVELIGSCISQDLLLRPTAADVLQRLQTAPVG